MKLEQWKDLIISNQLVGKRVRVLESGYPSMTDEGMDAFKASGKKELIGIVIDFDEEEREALVFFKDNGLFKTFFYDFEPAILHANALGYEDIELIQDTTKKMKKEETFTIQDLFEDYPEIGDIVEIVDTLVLSQSALEDYLLHFDKVIGKVVGTTKWGSLAVKINKGEDFGFWCGSHGTGINTVPIESLKVVKKAGGA